MTTSFVHNFYAKARSASDGLCVKLAASRCKAQDSSVKRQKQGSAGSNLRLPTVASHTVDQIIVSEPSRCAHSHEVYQQSIVARTSAFLGRGGAHTSATCVQGSNLSDSLAVAHWTHAFRERQLIQGALSPSIRRILTTCAKIKFHCVIAITPKCPESSLRSCLQ
jgi:hypothetical protein